MKRYLITWLDKDGFSHNGVFEGKGIKDLREQFECTIGRNVQITDIQILE